MSYSIRSLIKCIPNLIKSSHVDTGLKLEKAIASTFIPSQKVISQVKPKEGYGELLKKDYSSQMFRAFDYGYYQKSDVVLTSLLEEAKGEIFPYLNNPSEEDYLRELAAAYKQGKETTKKEATASNGFPTLPNSESISTEEAIQNIEEYISKLSPEAQKVFRYEFGIQYGGGNPQNKGTSIPTGMKTTASVNDEEIVDPSEVYDLANMVGSFSPAALSDRAVASVINSPESNEYLVEVEQVITGANKMSEDDLKGYLTDKLGYTISDTENDLDEFAEKLSDSSRLPGGFIFHNKGNSLVLSYYCKRSEIEPILNATKRKTAIAKSDKMQAPQGALSTKLQEEIKNIVATQSISSKSHKDIKKISPSVASYLSKAISDYRNGKRTQKELATLLKCKKKDLVEMVFGKDGAEYYDYCTSK